MDWTRREWLGSAAAAPLLGSAWRWLPAADDLALVVIELEGGNDGLNTLIPLEDATYARARPTLGQVRRSAVPIAPGFGLHAALAAWRQPFADGIAAAVHGVGYPVPDRSHFRSRDIWHTADPAHQRLTAATTGWLGRAADLLATRTDLPALGIGSAQMPLVLRGRRFVVPVLERAEDYELLVSDPRAEAAERAAITAAATAAGEDPHDPRAFLAGVARVAIDGAERLRAGLRRYRPMADYPDTAIARNLQLLARIQLAGFGTRLYHLTFGGFDTHARQLPTHEALLRQVGDAVAAFLRDLRAQRALDRVVLLIHSEFGRRVDQNQSLGTDHGAAAPVFLFGGGIRGGLHGTPPDLTRLDAGDLVATTDFRQVYAALLRRLRIDPAAVLGAPHAGLEL